MNRFEYWFFGHSTGFDRDSVSGWLQDRPAIDLGVAHCGGLIKDDEEEEEEVVVVVVRGRGEEWGW